MSDHGIARQLEKEFHEPIYAAVVYITSGMNISWVNPPGASDTVARQLGSIRALKR